jgi:O-antigen ligase
LLEHLASTGILGFLAMLLFHLFWLIEMVKRKDLIGQITIGFIVSLFVSGQVEYTLGDGETLFFLMFVYSWSQISRKVII